MTPLHESYLSAASALERMPNTPDAHYMYPGNGFDRLSISLDSAGSIVDQIQAEFCSDSPEAEAFRKSVAKRLKKMAETARARAIEDCERQLAKLRDGA